MKNYLRLAIMATGVAASIASVQANIIVNGGFETHGNFNSSGWNYFSDGSVTGWSSANSQIPLEVGRASVYGTTRPIGQDAVMELDSTANVTANQTLAASGFYNLTFLYAGRLNVAQSSTTFDVLWDNVVVASLNPAANPPVNTFGGYSIGIFTGAGNHTLSFRGTGTGNSLGALIDDVSLVAVPEPSTYVAGGLLLLPLIAQGIRSRRNRN